MFGYTTLLHNCRAGLECRACSVGNEITASQQMPYCVLLFRSFYFAGVVHNCWVDLLNLLLLLILVPLPCSRMSNLVFCCLDIAHTCCMLE